MPVDSGRTDTSIKSKLKITRKPDMDEVRKELKLKSLDRLGAKWGASCGFYYPCRVS